MNRELVSELRRAIAAGNAHILAQQLANRLVGVRAAVIIAPPVGPVQWVAMNHSPAKHADEIFVHVWLLLDPTAIDSKQTTFLHISASGRMHDQVMKRLYRLNSSPSTIFLDESGPQIPSLSTMSTVPEVSEAVIQEPWAESAECLAWIEKTKAVLNRPEFVEERSLPCEFLPFLLLSSGEEVSDPRWLAARGVTHVYSCCFVGTSADAGEWAKNFTKAGIKWRAALGALDDDDYPMLEAHFRDFEAFVCGAIGILPGALSCQAEAVSDDIPSARVLVHCSAGVNRSGLLAVALYMKITRMPLLEALKHCCEARGPLLWNESFRKQLVLFARDEDILE